MSKMSQFAMELDEQATELGFSSLSEALQAGCEVEYGKDTALLVEPLTAAHNAAQKQKKEIIDELIALRDDAADLAMGHGTHTDEWSKVALLADKVADYIKEEVR